MPLGNLPHILVIGDSLATGGAERVTVTLCNLLKATPADVRLHLMTGTGGVLRASLSDAIPVTGDADLPTSIAGLLDLCREFDPDVVLVNHSLLGLGAAVARRKAASFRLGVIAHAASDWYAAHVQIGAGVVDAWFGATTEIAEHLHTSGAPARLCHTLRPLVDFGGFQPEWNDDDHSGDLVIGYLGRISMVKAPWRLAESVARLRSDGVRVRCVIVGGPDPGATGEAARLEESRTPAYDAMEAAADLDGCEWIREPTSDPRPFLQSIDALALCSDVEGLPCAALEAMACGIPAILPDHGECAALTATGGGICYWPDYAPGGDLDDALRDFCAMSSDDRTMMGVEASKLALDRYSVQHAGDEWRAGLLAALEPSTTTPATVAGRRSFLITGGAGFIGSTLARRLSTLGYRVSVLDDLSTGLADNLADLNVELHVGSVCDRVAVARAARGCDGIVHLAARTSVPRSFLEPERTHEVNVGGTRIVLDVAAGRRVVMSSSSSVYGLTPTPQAEESADRAERLSPYAVSKWAGDTMVRAAGGVACRFFNVYGPHQRDDSPYTGVVALWARALLDGRPLVIYGDGLQSRGFVFVDDVVAALLRAMDRPAAGGRAINVGNPKPATLWRLLLTLSAAAQRQAGIAPPAVEMCPPRRGDIRHSQPDPTVARDLLGWRPRVSLADGMARTFAWYAGVPGWPRRVQGVSE